ncbi:MAG: ATP:cob(I)alamin adenosyltransferase, partial [Bacteroidota bacterium]
ARTVCRRAERECFVLAEADPENVPEIVTRYLNRLSDYLFVLTRFLTYELGIEETPWKPS